jgi:hypothetical protein
MSYTAPQIELLDAVWTAIEGYAPLADCEFLTLADSLPQDLVDPRNRLRNSIRVYPDKDNPDVYATNSSWEVQTTFRVAILGTLDTIDPRPLMECVHRLWKALAPLTRKENVPAWVQSVALTEAEYGDSKVRDPEEWDGQIEWAYVGGVTFTWLKGQAEMAQR